MQQARRATLEQPLESLVALRAVIGEPSASVAGDRGTALDDRCRDLIARAPFVLLATADAAGRCDVSPRGDVPGFVQVRDATTVVLPEQPGNRRADSLSNIVENPHVGLLFMVPNSADTLRVNGRAQVVHCIDQADVQTAQPGQSRRRPRLAIVVNIEECYVHCAQAITRGRLWNPTG